MDVEQAIKMLCIKTEMTQKQLAEKLNMSPQALSQKLKRRSFSLDDLKTIALLMNCKFECAFVFPDNVKITL